MCDFTDVLKPTACTVLGQGICHYNPGTRALLFISSFCSNFMHLKQVHALAQIWRYYQPGLPVALHPPTSRSLISSASKQEYRRQIIQITTQCEIVHLVAPHQFLHKAACRALTSLYLRPRAGSSECRGRSHRPVQSRPVVYPIPVLRIGVNNSEFGVKRAHYRAKMSDWVRLHKVKCRYFEILQVIFIFVTVLFSLSTCGINFLASESQGAGNWRNRTCPA